MAAEHLMIVGKGGVGKSTTAANLGAALAEAGKKVLFVGYDGHGGGTSPLRGKSELLPLPGWPGAAVPRYATGYRGTLCIEAGELTREGDDSQAASMLRHPLVVGYGADYVVHDVSWEPGTPMVPPTAGAGGLRMLVVTSADMGAVYVVNELFSWLNTVPAVNCRFAGVVINNLSGPLYESIVSDFVSQTGASIVANTPHSLMVSVSDFYNQTLIEAAPLSHVSYAYRKLARSVLEPAEIRRPRSLDRDSLRRWAMKWEEIIAELETGIVREGSNI